MSSYTREYGVVVSIFTVGASGVLPIALPGYGSI
jgi:hypothetical protein